MWRRIASVFPRGPADFALQVVIWGGFVLLYQVARGVADRSTEAAFDNGRWIIDFEQRLHSLIELDLQELVIDHAWLVHALNWTYWLSRTQPAAERRIVKFRARVGGVTEDEHFTVG